MSAETKDRVKGTVVAPPHEPSSQPAYRWRDLDWGRIPLVVGLLLVAAFFASRSPVFLTAGNLSNLVLQVAPIAVIALGAGLVLLLGEVDLSSGPLSAFGAAVAVVISTNHGLSGPVTLTIGLTAGLLLGAVSGGLVTMAGVPSFVVTLGASLAFTGGLIVVLGAGGSILIRDPLLVGLTSTFLPTWAGWAFAAVLAVAYAVAVLRRAARRRAAGLVTVGMVGVHARIAVVSVGLTGIVILLNGERGIPVVGVLVALLVVALDLLTRRTRFGRYLYAVGGNRDAARRAGVPVALVQTSVFALAGLLATSGGLLFASRASSVSTASGGGDLTLNAIAAAVIGGVSLFGGRGSVWGVTLGALVIGSTLNGMDLLSVSSGVKFIVIGVILIVAVLLDAAARRQRQRTGRL